MNLTSQIAKQFRDLHFGGNWTYSNLKEHLTGVTWEQATTKIESLNTIVALVYHINYYVIAATEVLQGRPLTASDKYSFDHPTIQSQEDWDKLVEKVFDDAERFITLIEQMPESKLWEPFADGKYGNFYRNIQGIIEHSHYHLGQIVLVKKLLLEKGA